jgi:hypothetical protein
VTHHLLSSLRRHALAAEHARNVDLSIGDSTGDESTTIDKENPTIGNEAHCRGVPILGRGIGGAINGTRPEDAIR